MGKVQLYAGDLTRILAFQVLPAGKVSPLKLDLTRFLPRFLTRFSYCVKHQPLM